MIALLLACSGPATEVPVAVHLEGAALARRISLDLRGVTPTLEELDRAAQDGGPEALTEEWLVDPLFEERLVDAFAEDWLLRLDELRVDADEFQLDLDGHTFTRAFGEEPARLMARVAAEDLPWTDVVTADWTMAPTALTGVLPIAFIDTDESKEWRQAQYLDGRPPMGVLMTSGLWLRYHTTLFNYNRGRAAVLARYLLCYDFLDRPVHVEPLTESDSQALLAATRDLPGCVACHAALDPLASSLFGFWPFEDKDGRELIMYHVERERYGETLMGLSPSYFGTPIDAAAQLGELVASDPRFRTCTAERTAARLWGRDVAEDDLVEVDRLGLALEDVGWSYQGLLREVIATDAYAVGGVADTATDAEVADWQTRRVMGPAMLASAVENLTGFRWEYEGWDQLNSDETGYRVLLGGADGGTVRQPNLMPTVSRSLVIERLAQAGADQVVDDDLVAAREDRRLVGTTIDDIGSVGADTAELRAELIAIHRRVLGVEPDTSELGGLETLWVAAEADSGAAVAWKAVVGLSLRDPAFWSY
jgi:hypothetical protein